MPCISCNALTRGLTGVFLLVVAKVRALTDRTTPFIRQMIEYTQRELHAENATIPLTAAINALLDDADRQVHLVAQLRQSGRLRLPPPSTALNLH